MYTKTENSKDKMRHLIKAIGVCGRVEFFVTHIVVFALISILWLYETRYTRLWDSSSGGHFFTIFGCDIRINTYVLFIVEYICMYGPFVGNLTVSLFVFLFSVSIISRSELLYLLLYVLLYVVYYIQGFRRCHDMGVSPWRMFIPLYMPIALLLKKRQFKESQ